MSEHFSTVLDRALVRLREGEPIGSILADQPSGHDRLAALLLTAQELATLRPAPAPAEPEAGLAAFLAHARSLRAEAAPEPARWRRLAARFKPSAELWRYPQVRLVASVMVALVVLLTLMESAIAMAATSLPGDLLYPAKLAGEEIQLSLTSDQTALARHWLARVKFRAEEVESLAQAGRPIDEATLARLNRSLEAVLLSTAAADPSAISRLLADIEETTAEMTAVLAGLETLADTGNQRQAQMVEQARLSLLQAQRMADAGRADVYGFLLSARLGAFGIGSSGAGSSNLDRVGPANTISP
jgi:hypothetical protein